MKERRAIHTWRFLEGRKPGQPWTYKIETGEVIVSATDKKGAIVRRPGCTRFYTDLKNLQFLP